MNDWIEFLLRGILGVLALLLALGLTASLLGFLGVPISKASHQVGMWWPLVVLVMMTYCWGLLGAYQAQLVIVFSDLLGAKWVLAAINGCFLVVIFRASQREANEATLNATSYNHRSELDSWEKGETPFRYDVYVKEIKRQALAGFSMPLLTFILGLILPSLIQSIYWGVGLRLARLFT